MKTRKGRVVGIDPGIAGAIALVGEAEPWVVDMPLAHARDATRYDVGGMAGLIHRTRDSATSALLVAIETSAPRPGHNAKGLWAQARGVALWEGICAALEVEYILVHGQTWVAAMGLRGAGKGGHQEGARRLFPDLSGRLEHRRDHGRADALLIAEWARLTQAPIGADV